MKKIYFMRHSKAGQTDKHLLNDHERPLTLKGEQLTPLLSDYFNENYKDNPPQLILCSTALRAKQTATIFKRYFANKEIEIRTFQELYITGTDEILSVIHKIEDKYSSVLIISHNPGLQAFCIKFSNAGDKAKFREMRSNFSPGSFATFEVDVKSWNQVTATSGTLLDFVNGKKLKG